RRLAVTDVGRSYYERCLRILREVEEAQALLRGDRSVRGLLSINAPVTLGLGRVVPALPPLMARHPGLRIDLRLEDRGVDLVEEGVELAIRTGFAPPDSASVVVHRLTTFRRVAVASPAYLRRHRAPADPAALARHDKLVHAQGAGAESAWRFLRDGEEQA